jgi:glycogen operon protein
MEGPTDDPAVLELRARQRRNMLATTLLSQGVPMLLHGDEIGRTQNGNNNAYCQDSELSWVDWELAEQNPGLKAFTAALTQVRRDHPVFRRRRFFAGRPIRKDDELRDIAWFTPSGQEMTEQDWESGFGRCVVAFLNGEGINDLDPRGERVTDDSFLMCFNAHHEDIDVTLPNGEYAETWRVVVDTATGEVNGDKPAVPAKGTLTVVARSLVVLQRVEEAG